MRLPFTVLLLCATATLAAQPVIEETAQVFDAARCSINHTSTMCIVKAVWETREKEPVRTRTAVHSGSGQYFVVTGSPNWLRATGDSAADLLLIDDSASAIIEVTWLEGENGDFDAVAREELKWLTDAMGSEPTKYEVSSGPFESNGSIYRMCYTTKRATGECQYSAAVNLPMGMVKVMSILSSDTVLSQQVLNIIASLNVPKPVDRKTQGDVLKMPTPADGS